MTVWSRVRSAPARFRGPKRVPFTSPAVKRVEESDKIIKDILKEVGDEMFIAEQVADITGDPIELTQRQASRTACSRTARTTWPLHRL